MYKPTQAQLMQDLLDGKKMYIKQYPDGSGWIPTHHIFINDKGWITTEKGRIDINTLDSADGKTEWAEYREPKKPEKKKPIEWEPKYTNMNGCFFDGDYKETGMCTVIFGRETAENIIASLNHNADGIQKIIDYLTKDK